MPYASFRYVRPDENWARVATLSASSFQTLYEASRAANGDPAWPWWAGSGTASLTATFPTAPVDIVALIHSNTDDARAIDISGAIAGTIPGARQANGYPKNVALIAPGGSGGSITVGVTANSAWWSVGELVVGKLRSFPYPLMRGAGRTRERNMTIDTDSFIGHEIRNDHGSEKWTASGSWSLNDAALAEFESWWESTNGGSLKTLIIPNDVDAEPRLCLMDAKIGWRNDGGNHPVDVVFVEAARGILVI